MDCFHDFCLFCDRDSPDGPYCSQQCKLADLERANHTPISPTSPTSHSHRESWGSYPLHKSSRTPSSNHASVRPQSSYFAWNSEALSEERQLTPSSSRTSLSSTTSSSTVSPGTMTSQAQQQLHEYFSSFDQARAAKRRSSSK